MSNASKLHFHVPHIRHYSGVAARSDPNFDFDFDFDFDVVALSMVWR